MFRSSSKQESIVRFNEMNNKRENKYPNVIYNTERKLGQLLIFYDYLSKIRNSHKSTQYFCKMTFKVKGYKGEYDICKTLV